MQAILVSIDFETFLIGPGSIAPKPVCMTAATYVNGTPLVRLHANGDAGWRARVAEVVNMAADGQAVLVGANISGFDLPVIHEHFPELRAAIWRALEQDAVRDVQVREKLLNLCKTGEVDHYYTPDGEQRDIRYDLATLAARYLGRDRSAEKGDGSGNKSQDIWRLHFDTLDGVSSDKYPVDAADYAKHDASDALLVHDAQEAVARGMREKGAVFPDRAPFNGAPFDPFRTEPLHVGAKFALQLMTMKGFRVDAREVASLREATTEALDPSRLQNLIAAGILLPAQPARPYRNGARNPDGTPRMVPAEPPHVSKKLLQARVETVVREENERRYEENRRHELRDWEPELVLKHTEKKQTSTDGEVIADLAPFDPVLAEYDHWSGLQKLMTLEIPRLEEALAGGGTIHPTFEELKRTGRTSSRKSRLFPSVNIQQIPRGFFFEANCRDCDGPGCEACGGLGKRGKKIEPRHAYLPSREGWVLCSVDYAALELVTAAQTVYSITGESVLRDKINAGYDPHAWLGAQIALACDFDFVEACLDEKTTDDEVTDEVSRFFPDLAARRKAARRRVARETLWDNRDETYRFFKGLSKGNSEERAFYKKYRSLAKPTGLGYPGGLGPRTFVGYAKKIYGITIEGGVEQAKKLKGIWLDAFPEFRKYFRWVESDCRETEEDALRAYGYLSPLGMYRAHCTYTACTNGAALQTPAGEGAKIGVFEVARACYDPEMRSCLFGCEPLAFVHDEMIVAIPEDAWMHERALEISRIMVEAMKIVCPDMVVKAEPALMKRWDKNAEYVTGVDGRIKVWE